MLFHIGPGKTDVTNEDKILVECRLNPQSTSVPDDKSKKGLVKTVFELHPIDETAVFVKMQDEAKILQNRLYTEHEQPPPRKIVILIHPRRTIRDRVSRMYIVSEGRKPSGSIMIAGNQKKTDSEKECRNEKNERHIKPAEISEKESTVK